MTLTDQELEASYLAEFDLGPGYPQLEVPEYVKRIYLDDTIEEISLRFPPKWTPQKQSQVDVDLSLSLKQFLSIGSERCVTAQATFSGSIALDRALSTVQIIGKRNGYRSVDVVTTTPCIDIMHLFLSERTNVRSSFVRSNLGNEFGKIDVSGLIAALQKRAKSAKKTQLCLLISSPENPTGDHYSEGDLARICKACRETGAILIVDHCFAVAGTHNHQELVNIWDVADNDLPWIAAWDTGKTFGLNEDKLGFLLTGSKEVTRAASEALAVIQFGVARRSKLFFAELFRNAIYFDHISELRNICTTNLSLLNDLTSKKFHPWQSSAGSLALVDISGTGHSDDTVREHLLKAGVGVVSGNVFFHTKWKKTNFIRIALARRPDYFQMAIERLLLNLP